MTQFISRSSMLCRGPAIFRQALLLQTQTQATRQYGMFDVNSAFNKIDKQRLKEYGGDRVAAEWILRCGGKIRFANADKYLTDYNMLSAVRGRRALEGIDTTGSSADDSGFRQHIQHLSGLKEVTLADGDGYLSNVALSTLSHVKDSLEKLEIQRCNSFTGTGLVRDIKALTNLKSLYLRDLGGVKNPEEVRAELQQALPKCKVEFPTGEKSTDEK